MRQWFVVNTQPTWEHRACRNLQRQGFDAWLPLCLIVKQLRRTRMTSKGPLFPTYLFVRIEPATFRGWHAIDETIGVAHVMKINDVPAAVDYDEVQSLRRLAALSRGVIVIDLDAPAAPPREFEKDQRLRVLDGPFAAFEGIYVEGMGERIKLLLDLFGRAVPITLSEAQVVPA
jgi:transcriptional antiterminator RfaH